MNIPVIFVLDDNGEATGEVHPFCSQACAKAFQEDEDAKVRVLIGLEAKYAWGHDDSDNHCDGLQCVECGCTIS